MINKNIIKERGITLVSLSIAIIIMIIISTTLIYNANTGIKTRELNNMYNDVAVLKDKIDIYYSKYGTIPIIKGAYTNNANLKGINPNDNDIYYVIDLEQLENLTLNYGQDYTNYKNDSSSTYVNIYVVNEQSHNVYYVKGITLDNKTYYTTQRRIY